MGLFFVPCIIYACFVLHNLCELQDINIDDDAVARQVAHDISQPENAPDQLYSFNTAEGTHVRNTVALFYKHIFHIDNVKALFFLARQHFELNHSAALFLVNLNTRRKEKKCKQQCTKFSSLK